MLKESDDVRNGLALRSDLHHLFDAGLITISADYKVEISRYLDSPTYRAYEDQSILVPVAEDKHPAPGALEFHQRFVFRR